MKIIDCKCKGNVVRFYLGKDNLTNWYGDDWDDYPASCNAGLVYREFISKIVDVAVPFEYSVLLPENDWRYDQNEPYCMLDYKDNKAPRIIIVPNDSVFDSDYTSYSEHVGDKNSYRIYLGDDESSILNIPKVEELKSVYLTYDDNTRRLYDESGDEFDT